LPRPFFLHRPTGLYVRFLIPQDLRAVVGSRFLVRSLKGLTGDRARLAAAQLGMALSQQFERLRLQDDDIKKKPPFLDFGIQAVTLRNGVQLKGIDIASRKDARLFADFVRDIDNDDDGEFADDPLMAVAHGRSPRRPAPSSPASPLVSERQGVYVDDMKRVGRAPKNILDTQFTLGLFIELVGDLPIGQIPSAHFRSFFDLMESWPASASKKKEFVGLSPAQVITKARQGDYALLESRTKEKHRDRLASFFNQMVREGVVDRVPHLGMMHPRKVESEKITRTPFDHAEIELIFGPAFQTWASKWAHRLWGTILGFATGARVNEVGRLYVQDVEETHGVVGIHIRASQPDQRLKNASSSRFVPLPQRVLVRLSKKVATNHHQSPTSKPAFPDWTRDAWLLIFALPLFASALRSTVFALPLFSFACRYSSHCLSPSTPRLAFSIRQSSKPRPTY
jgi:integrase